MKKKLSIFKICLIIFILFILLNNDILASENNTLKITDGWIYTYDDTDGTKIEYSLPEFKPVDWYEITLPKGAFDFELSKSRWVWFRVNFKIPEQFKGKDLAVFFGKIPNAARIYFNGSLIGTHGLMPPDKFFANPNISKYFTLPSMLINYENENTIAIQFYCERKRGSINAIELMENNLAQKNNFINSHVGSIVPSAASIWSSVL